MNIPSPARVISVLLFLLCVVPVLYAMSFRKEIFPWSSFPMYSGVNTGQNLYLISAFVVDSEGKEISLERTGILRPKYEYRWRVDADDLKDRSFTDSEKAMFQRFAEIFKDDLSAKGLKYDKVRFYLEYWNSFTGPARHTPDERRVLLEQTLQ